MGKILMYGAYGYTGRLIIEEALKSNLEIIVSGRNKEKTASVAKENNLNYQAFDLEDTESLHAALDQVDVVIHCAGPFQFTAKQMIEACIQTKTHYLDITGEYQVFELGQQYNDQAKNAGIMILPGAGFDVVPSDCLAANLKAMLPTATHLELAFASKGKSSMSRGTAKTMVEGSSEGQVYRANRTLKEKPLGKSSRIIDYGEFEQISVGISWGDISSAFFSTQIPNIEVFMGSTRKQINSLKWVGRLSFLLKMRAIKNFAKKKIDAKPAGPSSEKREKSATYLWGRVSDGQETKEARITTPNGYTLTALTATLFAVKILEGDYQAGYQTPSTAYGKDVIFEIPGCSWLE